MPKILALIWLCVLLCLSAWPGALQAQERILSFDVTLTVNSDASLRVKEVLRVACEGAAIRHGLFRVIPTSVQQNDGSTRRHALSDVSAFLDGKAVLWKLDKSKDSVRLRIGDAKTRIRPGEHVFSLTYTLPGQLLLHADYDELYWNVTGHDWAFPIDKASVVVQLPGGAAPLRAIGFTGSRGATGKAYRATASGWETTRPLARGEGFTIAVAFAKGLVVPPGPGIVERLRQFCAPYRYYVSAVLVLLSVLYYAALYHRAVQRDTVIPLFRAPNDMDPGFLRYARDGDLGDEGFAANILHMAARGALVIEEHSGKQTDGKPELQLRRTVSDPSALHLSSSLRKVFRRIFLAPVAQETFNLGADAFSGDVWAVRNLMEQECATKGRGLFEKHRLLCAAGLLPMLALLVCAPILSEFGRTRGGDISVVLFCLFLIPVGLFLMYAGVAGTLNTCSARNHESLPQRVRSCILFLFLGAAGAAVLVSLGWLDLWYTAALALPTVLCAFSMGLLRLRTAKGRALLAQVQGLALYLRTAETHRLNSLHPPDETPESISALFPYAYALDCVEGWAAHFDLVLEKAAELPQQAEGGRRTVMASRARLISLGNSLCQRAARSASPPNNGGSGRQSGGFHGGRAGGGRGGGGGGGW